MHTLIKIDPNLFDLENEKKKITIEKQNTLKNLMRSIHIETVNIASNNGFVNDLKLEYDLITAQIEEEEKYIEKMKKLKKDYLNAKNNNQMEVKNRINQLMQN